MQSHRNWKLKTETTYDESCKTEDMSVCWSQEFMYQDIQCVPRFSEFSELMSIISWVTVYQVKERKEGTEGVKLRFSNTLSASVKISNTASSHSWQIHKKPQAFCYKYTRASSCVQPPRHDSRYQTQRNLITADNFPFKVFFISFRITHC